MRDENPDAILFNETQRHGDPFEVELSENPIQVDPNDPVAIKRARNTLAARNSQPRRTKRTKTLENHLKKITKEKDMWRTQAVDYGHPIEEGQDEQHEDYVTSVYDECADMAGSQQYWAGHGNPTAQAEVSEINGYRPGVPTLPELLKLWTPNYEMSQTRLSKPGSLISR